MIQWQLFVKSSLGPEECLVVLVKESMSTVGCGEEVEIDILITAMCRLFHSHDLYGDCGVVRDRTRTHGWRLRQGLHGGEPL